MDPDLTSQLKETTEDISRRFRCKICQKAFTKSDHLARHQRSHLKLTPFACQHCFKSFGRQDVLSRHIRKMHQTTPSDESLQSHESHGSSSLDQGGAFSGGFNMGPTPPESATPPSIQPSNQALPPSSSKGFIETTNMFELISEYNLDQATRSAMLSQQHASHPESEASGLSTFGDQLAINRHQYVQPTTENIGKVMADLCNTLSAGTIATGVTPAFLETCIHAFFDRFIPAFPVLHKPTFLAGSCCRPLLFNIIAIGSLFGGARDAVTKGEALWRQAQSTIHTSWRSLIENRGPKDSCSGVQLVLTILLAQTYAFLSKNKTIQTSCQAFLGQGFSWARQVGMYQESQAQEIPPFDSSEDIKMDAWYRWNAKEIQRRTILGLYILDGQISRLLGQPTCSRHVINPLLAQTDDSAFSAPTANEWIREMTRGNFKQQTFQEALTSLFSSPAEINYHIPSFSVQVILEGLQSLVSDMYAAKGAAVGIPAKAEISRALLRLYDERLSHASPTDTESMELLVRWHSICLGLATLGSTLRKNVSTLWNVDECLRTKPFQDYSCEKEITSWCQSTDGLRCLLHAMAIQEIVEKLPLGRSHAIHLPQTIFSVATVYVARCMAGLPMITVPNTVQWDEVWYTDLSGISRSSTGNFSIANETTVAAFLHSRIPEISGQSSSRNLLYEVNLLQITLSSISARWGVTDEMEEDLQKWLTFANQLSQPNA